MLLFFSFLQMFHSKDLIYLKLSEFILSGSYKSKVNNKNPHLQRMFEVKNKTWKQWQLLDQNNDNLLVKTITIGVSPVNFERTNHKSVQSSIFVIDL